MNRIIRLSSCAVIGLALWGCGPGADAVKKVEPVSAEQKADLQSQHAEAVKAQSGGGDAAKQQ
jgi:hypothetical protein